MHTWAETVPVFVGNHSVGMHGYWDHVFLNGDGIIEISLAIQKLLCQCRPKVLVELGSQMEVPWELAWTCLLPGSQACRLCPACRRRRRRDNGRRRR